MASAVLLPFLLFLILHQQVHLNLAAGNVHFKKGAPHVQLVNGGVVSGSVEFSRDGRPYTAFMGIPYATIPERFNEPQPIVKPTWEGTFSATKPGAICPQKAFGNDPSHVGHEDCLSLNVYVPMSANGSGKKGFPVMVWIHGGSFRSGFGHMYGAKYFMDENVVIVTINYRLGVFGFLSTGDNIIPGNNGLKDMVMALRWVQDNIGVFGGNPGLVTIFGESAGAAAIHYLMLSPTTKGLFHRAISQSGTALGMWAYEPNPKQIAVDLATYLKCPTVAANPTEISSQEILKCLKNVPMEELNKAQFIFSEKHWPRDFRIMFFVPTAEPVDAVSNLTPFMSVSPMLLVSDKKNNLTEIPFMVGCNEDEGTLFSGPILANSKTLQEMDTNWEYVAPLTFDYGKYIPIEKQSKISQELRNFYFGDKTISEETRDEITNAYTDGNLVHGIYRTVIDTAARGKRNPVYFYQYVYSGPISLMGTILQFPPEEAEKVGHGDELVHLFDLDTLFGQTLIKPDTPDEEFSKNLVRLWASFAIHGEPKHTWGTAPFRKWERISKREAVGLDATRWFQIDSNPSSLEIPYSILERIKWWDNLWYEYIVPPGVPVHMKNEQPDGVKVKTEL